MGSKVLGRVLIGCGVLLDLGMLALMWFGAYWLHLHGYEWVEPPLVLSCLCLCIGGVLSLTVILDDVLRKK